MILKMLDVEDLQNLRIRLSPRLAEEMGRVVESQKTTKQAAITAVLEWFCAQDKMFQAMILGQAPHDPEVAELAIRRMSGKANGEMGIVDRGNVTRALGHSAKHGNRP